MTGRDRTKPVTPAGSQDVGQPAASDTTHTEGELMDRAVEDARDIAPPPDATGSLADPVAGSGFTRHESSRDNPLGDTTVSQPFEDLTDLEDPDKDSNAG